MAKVYFVRHQAAGVLWEHPFSEPPTEEQQAALAKLCFQTHGSHHSKVHTDENGREHLKPFWIHVREVELLGPDAVIAVPERGLSLAKGGDVAVGSVGEIGAHGTGTVTPKAGA